MADTSNLTNFLGDIADAIRTKKSTTEEIPAANFDTEILSIETGSGIGDVKLFETIDEMQADKNPNEGDLAIVYRSEIQNMTVDTQTQYITFPETVVLPEAFTGDVYCMLRAVDETVMFDGTVMLNSNSFRFDGFTDNGMIRVEYSSADGIKYNRDEFRGDSGDLTNPVDLGTSVGVSRSDEWNDNFGYFMQVDGNTFEGLYKYDGIQYDIVETQLDATADLLYNSTAYGKNGVIEGTITQNVSNSFADINAEIYYKIQQAYDNMEPRVLTDSDKTIDKNIYFIPTNANGEPLLDTSKVTNMQSMFSRCTGLTDIPLLDTSSATNMQSMFSSCTNLQSVPLLDTSNVTNMKSMFSSCTNLQSVPLLDTSSATNMQSMFSSCTNLQSVPLLDTSNVTNMSVMFSNCTGLTNIPLLDTSNVTNMSTMFYNCENLQSIPQLNTSQVTNTYAMFYNCTGLTNIPLLDTSSVTSMMNMFYKCSALTSVPELNTINVVTMNQMFCNCINLIEVPVLNTTKGSDLEMMFDNCPKLSDESLNNILQMCIDSAVQSSKTLKYIGLSEEQATTCTTLSNYQAFLDAGWTTGY